MVDFTASSTATAMCNIFFLAFSFIYMLMFAVTSQDFFDSRIMEAIRRQLTVFSNGRQINYDVSGKDVMFQHAVSCF